MSKTEIIISSLLTLSLLSQAIGNILDSYFTSLKEKLSENKLKMAIESQSQAIYDNRISVRSLENITRTLLPKGTIENKIGEKGVQERYTSEPLMYKGKRDLHTERYNKLTDIMNQLEPNTKTKLARLGILRKILNFVEFAGITLALVCLFINY